MRSLEAWFSAHWAYRGRNRVSGVTLTLLSLVLLTCCGMAIWEATPSARSMASPVGRVALTFSAVPEFTPRARSGASSALTAVGCVSGPTFAVLSVILGTAPIVHRRKSAETIEALKAELERVRPASETAGART
jgi:hypothetical protein